MILCFVVDHSIVDKPKPSQEMEFDPILIIIIVGNYYSDHSSDSFFTKKAKNN